MDQMGLACPCCGVLKSIYPLINDMENLELILSWQFSDVSLNIQSGYRCWNHHRDIYIKKGWIDDIPRNSRHLTGEAVDVVFKSGENIIPPAEIAYIVNYHSNFLHATHFKGIGIMDTSIHLDIRPHPATWILRDGAYVYDIDIKQLIKNR